MYEGISRARQVDLHRRVAEAIESTYGARLDEHLPDLAHHYGLAAAGGNGAKAVAYAQQAGDRSLALLANDEAATYFRQALDLLDLAELDDASCEPRRCALTISLGDAQRRSGDVAHRQTLLDGAALARRLGDPEKLA